MKDSIFKGLGRLAGVQGKLMGMSDEFNEFYRSGYCCLACNKRLVSALGQLSVKFYGSDGKPMSAWALPVIRAEKAECPECGHRWSVRRSAGSEAPATPASAEIEVIETERTEERIGDEQKTVDNSHSRVGLKRKFLARKEWSRSFSIAREKATVVKTGARVAVHAVVNLSAGFDQTLKERYSASDEIKEAYSEEVEFEVPGFTILTVTFRWKRLWQHGHLRLRRGDGEEWQVPFKVATGLSFDSVSTAEGPDRAKSP